MSRFWQWDRPLACPKGHERMGWLGGRYWMCGTCKTVYVEVQGTEFDTEGGRDVDARRNRGIQPAP